jgi:hypothetical protein
MNTFKDDLNYLFDIPHSNTINIIKIHENKLFLIKNVKRDVMDAWVMIQN